MHTHNQDFVCDRTCNRPFGKPILGFPIIVVYGLLGRAHWTVNQSRFVSPTAPCQKPKRSQRGGGGGGGGKGRGRGGGGAVEGRGGGGGAAVATAATAAMVRVEPRGGRMLRCGGARAPFSWPPRGLQRGRARQNSSVRASPTAPQTWAIPAYPSIFVHAVRYAVGTNDRDSRNLGRMNDFQTRKR